MSVVIADPTGGTNLKIKDGKALTNAENNLTGNFASLDDGLAFNTISHDASAVAGTFVFYFKNTSKTKKFFVDILRVGAVETSLWKVWSVTGTAAGGSEITPVNLNLTSGVTAEATARGDDAVTGLTQVNEIATVRVSANGHSDISFDDILILGTDDAIAVEYDTGTTGIAEVLMRGYYK